ncbi:hypothetical protein [Mucilaginibacter sp. SP1R1]|uniref:hypothetical protein n=1 Tax=Mucilaginibacter sp. SP1R1 TaxID=2723091 RepID=UPI001619B13E|nr:hypothetical protein [Mucilaginibacter sp. SP1R1]MBB6147460.1 hypothetical protein [Mucilaginibacter sp. SP1R1]
MKKVVLLLFLFLFACSGNKQNQVEKVVKLYLDTVLNDPHSYERIKFDSISRNYADYTVGDPEGRELVKLAQKYLTESSKHQKMASDNLYISHPNHQAFDRNLKLSKVLLNKADSVQNIIDIKGKGYKGSLFSYTIEHTYRAKNGFGALTIHKTRFIVDSAITKVIFSKEIKE